MSDHADGRPWTIGRLLYATQLPFLLICTAVFAGALLVLTFAIDLRATITESVWDPAVSVVRWFALGYGVYLINRLLPLYVAAGFYRSGGNELVAVVLSLAMVVVTGYGIGFNGLPLVGAAVDLADLPLAGTLALCLAGLLPGAAATWAMVRDIAIRNR